ncbi:MAG: lycopene cyclase domain-containing protein, partial [Candidatus Aramenus sp.]|nr:lycopene cyclase domain-containing protein [Candidatus Aramenus sp.]
PHSILGFRISTIPWEDAVYSFSMMNFYALFYRRGVAAWRKV